MKRSLLITVCASLAVALGPATRGRQTQVFRAAADYVRVDVVVTDKDDKPITDLRKDEFAIEEHGRTQTIDDFQFVFVPLMRRTIDLGRAAPPKDVASNVPVSPKSRLFVLIIDDLHILEQDLTSVKRIMTEFFQSVSPDDEVAVVFTGHSNLSQNFTTDPVLLMKTVDHVRDALGFGLDALGRANNSNSIGPEPRTIRRAAEAADLVLKNVATSLAGSTWTRRAMIYVSDGSVESTVPIPTAGLVGPPMDDFDDLQEVYEMARRSNVPIYTVDPRGQPLPEESVRGGIGAIGGFGGTAGETVRASIVSNIQKQEARLTENAVNTGGRAFTNQSDLMRAVDEIVGDNSSYYLLGYYPAPFEADGEFHSLTVHVARPGTRVRARQGYVASTTQPAGVATAPAVNQALNAGVNVSGISLTAFAAPVAATDKGMNTVVTVEVAYPPPANGSRLIDDELQMSVLAIDPDGRIKASASQQLHFKGTVHDQRPATFLINQTIELPAQPLTLKVGIGSRGLGRTGTVQIPIEAPKISDKLQLGGVVLGFAGPAREAAMQSSALANLLPFQPITTRVFGANDSLRVFARAFWTAKDESGSVTVSLPNSGLAQQTATLTGTRASKGRAEAVLDVTFPLIDARPGSYSLVVEARLANGETAKRTVPIEVR